MLASEHRAKGSNSQFKKLHIQQKERKKIVIKRQSNTTNVLHVATWQVSTSRNMSMSMLL